MSQLQRVPMLLITQCPDTSMWYRHRVGQLVPHVGWVADSGYKSREPGGFVNFVRTQDARPIEIYVKPEELAHWPFNSARHIVPPQTKKPKPVAVQRIPVAQTRVQTLIETVSSVAVAWLLSLAITPWVMGFFGMPVTLHQNVAITSIFTAVSLARSYSMRRFFNHIHRTTP